MSPVPALRCDTHEQTDDGATEEDASERVAPFEDYLPEWRHPPERVKRILSRAGALADSQLPFPIVIPPSIEVAKVTTGATNRIVAVTNCILIL